MQNADLTKKNRSIIKNEKFIFIYKNGLRYFNVWGYWNWVLVSNKIFFGEKNYKYFIDYLYNEHKVKPLHIMLP